MQDLRKVGRVGGKALLYFEIVSTLALVVGIIVGNMVRPGSGFNVDAIHSRHPRRRRLCRASQGRRPSPIS